MRAKPLLTVLFALILNIVLMFGIVLAAGLALRLGASIGAQVPR